MHNDRRYLILGLLIAAILMVLGQEAAHRMFGNLFAAGLWAIAGAWMGYRMQRTKEAIVIGAGVGYLLALATDAIPQFEAGFALIGKYIHVGYAQLPGTVLLMVLFALLVLFTQPQQPQPSTEPSEKDESKK